MRRSRAACLIGAGAAGAFARPVRAQAPAPLRVVTTYLESAAGAFYAEQQGLFRKYGLAVDLQVMANGTAAASAVLGGAADVGSSNVYSLILAHTKHVGLSLIAASAEYLHTAPTTALVVAKNAPIRKPGDLSGKTIAVTGLGDLDAIAVDGWLDENGVGAKNVKFVELRPPSMAAALQRGAIDAAQIGSPALQPALADGRVIGLTYDSVAQRFNQNGWYVKTDWFAQHREQAHSYSRAVFEAQAWANRNHDASARLLAQWAKLDPGLIATMTRVVYSERFEPALLQPVIEIAARYSSIPASFPATELYDPSL